MKWGVMLILVVFLSPYVLAENIKLSAGESYVKYGVNITLAKLDKSYEKAVICVNNEKQILEDEQLTYFKDARVELNDIDAHDKSIEIDVKYLGGCYNCKCEDDCLNENCKISTYDEFGDLIKKDTEVTGDAVKEPETIKVKEQRRFSKGAVVIFGIIGGVFGMIFLWMLWFRKVAF